MVLTATATAATRSTLPVGRTAALAATTLIALLAFALVATIVSAPIRHDEQLFVSAGLMFGRGDLYRDFGYNHLPNLPILLKMVALAGGAASPVLAFRWIIVAAWAATGWLLARFAWRATTSLSVTLLACLLLVASPLLGGQAGTLVTNNFMPVPFALAGLFVFLDEATQPRPRAWKMALAGFLLAVAVGMKANYVLLIPPFAVTALLAPPALPLRERLLRVGLPMLAGGVIGGLPTLWAAASEPAVFIDHVFGYHRGPHLAWALASSEPLVISMNDRLALGLSLWGSGSTLLLGVAVVAVGGQLLARGWRPDWRVWLVVALVIAGAVVAFVPRPSFPQYFVPPLPFALALLVQLAGAQSRSERGAMMPLFAAVALLSLMIDAPRLVSRLPALARPAGWTGVGVHEVSRQVVGAAHRRPVATLSPIYALEAGGTVYPELVSGPFVYRVADLMKPDHRRLWRLVSPSTLAARLDADRPGAILVGAEGKLDDAFRNYAIAHGYRRLSIAGGQTRYGALELFVPTSASSSLPPPIRTATSSVPSPVTR